MIATELVYETGYRKGKILHISILRYYRTLVTVKCGS